MVLLREEPGRVVELDEVGSQSRAPLPISSASSRRAVSSSSSPSPRACPRAARAAPLADRLARLAHHPDRARRRTGRTVTAPGWLDDLARGLPPVVVAEGVDPHRRRCGPARSPRCRSARSPSGLPRRPNARPARAPRRALSRAPRTVTVSSGWWLRSVPLAMFSTGRPAAISALASLPPPVAT